VKTSHPDIYEQLERRYLDLGNPLWAWHAYALARQQRDPVPAWVLAYFDAVANRLVDYFHEDTEPADGSPGPIGRRLGFAGLGLATARRRMARPADRDFLGLKVAWWMAWERLSMSQAIARADELGTNRTDAYKALFGEEPLDLMLSWLWGHARASIPPGAVDWSLNPPRVVRPRDLVRAYSAACKAGRIPAPGPPFAKGSPEPPQKKRMA
jgi:hypothetical protein